MELPTHVQARPGTELLPEALSGEFRATSEEGDCQTDHLLRGRRVSRAPPLTLEGHLQQVSWLKCKWKFMFTAKEQGVSP